MGILYKDIVVQEAYYKGKRLKKIYKGDTLVFYPAYYAQLIVKWYRTSRPSTKPGPNPAHAVWQQKLNELISLENTFKGYYEDAYADGRERYDWNKYNSQVQEKQGDLIRAEMELSNWLSSNPEPDRMIENPRWTDWNAEDQRLLSIYRQAEQETQQAQQEWQQAKNAYDSRVNEVNAAINAYNNHHSSPKPPETIKVESQAWRTWNSQYESRKRIVDFKKSQYEAAKNEYNNNNATWKGLASVTNAARMKYNNNPTSENYDAWQRAQSEEENYLNNVLIPSSERKDAAYTEWSDASSAFMDWKSSNPEPERYEWVHNPEYDNWINTDAALKREAERLSNAWDNDKSTYADNIRKAENKYDEADSKRQSALSDYNSHHSREPTKMIPNPDHSLWEADKGRYDQAVSLARSELNAANREMQDCERRIQNDSTVKNARIKWENATAKREEHQRNEPPKIVPLPITLYTYYVDIKLNPLPKKQSKDNITATFRFANNFSGSITLTTKSTSKTWKSPETEAVYSSLNITAKDWKRTFNKGGLLINVENNLGVFEMRT